jgi:hypothetical protein
MKQASFLFALSMLAPQFSCPAQSFTNLQFKDVCPGSPTGLCAWELSWGSKKDIKQDEADGKKCLLIEGSSKNSVGFAEQSGTMPPLKEMAIVTVTAMVRSQEVDGRAGLNLNVYDSTKQLLTYTDMGSLYSLDWNTGTTKWKKRSISLICPAGTAVIKIGAILYGKGKAWFSDYTVTVTPVGSRKYSKLAEKYISAACDTIKQHSLVRDSLNIDQMRTNALHIAGNAKKHSDCYLAVKYLLMSLRDYGDFHSFFMKKEELENWKDGGSVVNKVEYGSGKLLEGCGYINVPAFHNGNPKTMKSFADSMQALIHSLDTQNIKGWIIDLRENTGGNMVPMIAGLGPLFSEEKLGSLVNVNGVAAGWYYKNGKYLNDDLSELDVTVPVTLTVIRPIAVLTSSRIGSSGEIVVISFVGNANTKSFGQTTMGLTTGNGSFDLPDGSRMFLASTIMADRSGKQYHRGVVPDVLIEEGKTNEPDPVIKAAIEWIKGK